MASGGADAATGISACVAVDPEAPASVTGKQPFFNEVGTLPGAAAARAAVAEPRRRSTGLLPTPSGLSAHSGWQLAYSKGNFECDSPNLPGYPPPLG